MSLQRVKSAQVYPSLVRTTYRDPVVPDRNIIFIPLETGMHLLSGCNNIGEVFDDGVALGFGYAHNLGHESRVEEQCVPAGDRVRADERVFSGYRVPANRSTKRSRVVGLHVCRVQG